MNELSEPVLVMSDDECWGRLATQEVGRIVTRIADRIDIFPVNYVVDDGSLLMRTAQGSKLFELTVNDEVLFEVDGHDDAHAWSVVVRGRAHALDTSAEVEHADSLGLRPWIPTLKRVYVRIVPESMSGRSFERGPEPDRYGVQPY
ncbi:pyridoxamine 5'-phosphate oxidase family protein [Microbacterium rhizosphaerae]|uniref:Pyridoxamine 5'-phosphate oxidase family protein n=1 Tax=Microbacterium rhizosphaerae TaxID=1678237 RepID=A0ABZ0SGN9_9MICO|nr:pyridoxamine 5'-phosphate oxidase family protein [Microbacterium rhizosphaerae]WPR88301.1 pyridoxamine 5'-phosphate oxidase family protein [Microbacterium rhizosphaerae]